MTAKIKQDNDRLIKMIDSLTSKIYSLEKYIRNNDLDITGHLTCGGNRILNELYLESISRVQADAIELAISETRKSMKEGCPRWLCRVEDLQEYAERLR